MTTVVVVVLLLAFNLLQTASPQPSTTPSSPPPPSGCAAELVSFSPCLSYVSQPPNNLSERPTSQCCDAVSSVFDSDDGECLCYLLGQPLILGFPLNKSRVISLSSACNTDGSLGSICSSGSTALPPLRSSTGSETSKPLDSGPVNGSAPSVRKSPHSPTNSPPILSSPAAHGMRSPRVPSLPLPPASDSFPTNQVSNSYSWLQLGIQIFTFAFLRM